MGQGLKILIGFLGFVLRKLNAPAKRGRGNFTRMQTGGCLSSAEIGGYTGSIPVFVKAQG